MMGSFMALPHYLTTKRPVPYELLKVVKDFIICLVPHLLCDQLDKSHDSYMWFYTSSFAATGTKDSIYTQQFIQRPHRG